MLYNTDSKPKPHQGHTITRVLTRFVEDEDQIFEMEAEGQFTEFHSEEDAERSEIEGKSIDRNKVHYILKPVRVASSTIQTDSDEETEVFFRESKQVNNNVTVHLQSIDDSAASDEELKEGECSQHLESARYGHGRQTREDQPGTSASDLIDEHITSSLAQFQTYFNKKFENLSKVMELERQLGANHRHLDELKTKGTEIPDGNDKVSKHRNKEGHQSDPTQTDCESVITIYRNAVEKK